MQNGSHSRNSYPLDKMVPKTIIRGTNKDRVPPGATIKKMHKKKQRQYNGWVFTMCGINSTKVQLTTK
jgi:hypothetical protein